MAELLSALAGQGTGGLWRGGPGRRTRRLAWATFMAALLTGCSDIEELFGFGEDSNKDRDRSAYVDEADTDAEEQSGDSPLVYGNTHQAHYLAKVLDEGATLVLEDGSVWKVEPRDLIYSGVWKALQDIVVHDMDSTPQYKLVNASTREQVMAVYLGTPRRL